MHSRTPPIRSEHRNISRFVDVDGLGTRGIARFEREIHWVRECEASTRVVNSKGREIASRSTYHDFYGFLHCVAENFMELAGTISGFDVGPDGPIEIQVMLKIMDSPMINAREGSPVRGMWTFDQCPNDWIASSDDEIAAWRKDPDARLHRISPKILYEGAIWNSRMLRLHPDDQISAVETIMRLYSDHLEGEQKSLFEGRVRKVIQDMEKVAGLSFTDD